MLNLKQLSEEIKTIESLNEITEALGDVATSKLKSTRASMQQNIEFFQEIFQVYRTLKLQSLRNPKIQNSKTLESLKKQKNGKTVCLLLTSNERFNGSLDTEITNFFISKTSNLSPVIARSEATKQSNSEEEIATSATKVGTRNDASVDFIVVGALGQEFLKASNFPHQWEGVTFKKDFPSLEELKALSEKIFKYSKILVFHTQFITVLNQPPAVSDLTSSDIQVRPQDKPVYFIIEPDIDKMIEFFETQIFILLFQAIFLEVDLARLAARMISMNQAGDSALKILDEEKKEMLRTKKQILNLKIQETYAGMIKRVRSY